MPKSLLDSDLRSLLSSTVKKQSYLAGHHPAALAAPLVAFAVADMVKRRTGSDYMHGLIGANAHVEVDKIELSSVSSQAISSDGLFYSKIYESCLNCAISDAKRPANTLTWMTGKTAS